MKKILLTTVALLVGGSAFAADLSLKTPKLAAVQGTGCDLTQCVGFIVGVDVFGAGTNLDILGNGLNGSINAAGMRMGGHVGYRAWANNLYYGVDAGCSYDMSQGTTGIGISPSDRLFCTELVRGGGSLTALFGTNGQIQLPMLSNMLSLYAIAGAAQKGSANGMASGAGAEFLVTPKITIRTEYLHVKYGDQTVAPTMTISDENIARVALDYNW